MSFFKSLKGLADDFKDLMSDKDKEKKQPDQQQKPVESSDSTDRGAADSYYQQQPQYGQGQQQYDHQQNGRQQYSQQSYPPQSQHQQGPPPDQSYGVPFGPQLPSGWIRQWDQNSQRPYYLEQATGRTQWDPPSMSHADQNRGYDNPQGYGGPTGTPHGYSQGYSAPAGSVHSGGGSYPTEATQSGEKQKSNKGALLAAGAGGIVVGGLAGAALAGDSSDDEYHASAAQGAYGAPAVGYGAPVAQDPEALEHNSDVSSSQRSSLEEARKDHEEAQEKAADSDASSSDLEEAREAREEYQEEIGEAQEEAYED